AQAVVVLQRFSQIPSTKYGGNSRYCLNYNFDAGCQLEGFLNTPVINWELVWADVARDLSFVMTWGLIVIGVYLLSADLSKETRRGTLNFLRMSPLPGRQVLLGKLMGVPVLLYLGVAAMIPLHLMTAVVGQYPLWLVLMFYGALSAIALCFYSASLWVALLAKGLQGLQTWLMSALSFGILMLSVVVEHTDLALDWFYFLNPANILLSWPVDGRADWRGMDDLGWFFTPLGSHRVWLWTFALANAAMLSFWFWTVLERKFLMPANTSLGKQQSYGLTLCLSLLMMGFNLQSFSVNGRYWTTMDALWSYLITMLIWGVVLLFLLLPSKQMLLDWTRYRHQQPHPLNRARAQQPDQPSADRRHSKQQSPRKRHSLLADLMYHDGSPFVFSYVVNMAIVFGVLLLGVSMGSVRGASSPDIMTAILSWLFCGMVLVVCALALQWIVLSNLLHWRWVAFGSVATIVAGWPILLLMLGIEPYRDSAFSMLWLLTAFPHSVMWGAGWGELLTVMLSQLTLISGLSMMLGRRCQLLGQSEWKALMASGRVSSLP
ncbi:MAG: hypothetical protein AAFU53_12905, partial [Cyanobacteria bacterium J06632_3]